MYNQEQIKQVIFDAVNTSKSMKEAASKTKLHFNTFKKYAIQFGLYNPNQAGKGISKNMPKTPLKDILEGKYPYYHTFKLHKRLIQENIKLSKCEQCNLIEWNNQPIPLELDHIDGNLYNHLLSNLRLLCPNCHAQTSTHRGKNKGAY